MRSAVVLAIAPALISPRASAEFYTGNKLYEYCKAAESFGGGVCGGYVVGVLAGVEFVEGATKGVQTICIPDSATAGQVRDVVVRYLDAHPEKRHLHAGGLVWAALSAAFPCESKR